jgi:hypothetical protein
MDMMQAVVGTLRCNSFFQLLQNPSGRKPHPLNNEYGVREIVMHNLQLNRFPKKRLCGETGDWLLGDGSWNITIG